MAPPPDDLMTPLNAFSYFNNRYYLIFREVMEPLAARSVTKSKTELIGSLEHSDDRLLYLPPDSNTQNNLA